MKDLKFVVLTTRLVYLRCVSKNTSFGVRGFLSNFQGNCKHGARKQIRGCLVSRVVFLSRGGHKLTGREYVLTDIIIRDFIVGPPVLDDVALCAAKSLLLSRSDVSVLDSPSLTDKGWTARWVSVARIQRLDLRSLPVAASSLAGCLACLSSPRSSTDSNGINYLELFNGNGHWYGRWWQVECSSATEDARMRADVPAGNGDIG